MRDFIAGSHPVCGPLVRGGPALLAQELGYVPHEGAADACHLCFLARRLVIGVGFAGDPGV
jgi:hypothetical protein